MTDPGVDAGLTRIWAIVDPLDALAPVTPPVVPAIVHANAAPATLLVSAILVVAALHMVVGLTVVTLGVGLIVMVNDCIGPSQVFPALVKCGVTVIVNTTGVVPVFEAVKAAILPELEPARP